MSAGLKPSFFTSISQLPDFTSENRKEPVVSEVVVCGFDPSSRLRTTLAPRTTSSLVFRTMPDTSTQEDEVCPVAATLEASSNTRKDRTYLMISHSITLDLNRG